MNKQMAAASAAVIAVCFLVGVVIGCFVASGPSGEAAEYLSGYVSSLPGDGAAFPVAQAVVNSFLFPIVVFVLSFTVFGAVAIPLAVAVRAFFLSFAIASFVRSFGGAGALLALGALGPQNLLSLPCLVLLSVQGMTSSLAVVAVFSGKPKRAGGFYGKQAMRRAIACFAVLLAASLLEAYLVPPLFSSLAAYV